MFATYAGLLKLFEMCLKCDVFDLFLVDVVVVGKSVMFGHQHF